MDPKTLGWIQVVGGTLALLSSGQIGYSGMIGMMGGGYNMMSYGSGLGVTLVSLLFIITGVYHLTEKKRR